jgi:hypothetical protein
MDNIGRLIGGGKPSNPASPSTPSSEKTLLEQFSLLVWIFFIVGWSALNVVFTRHILSNAENVSALQSINPSSLGMLKLLFNKVWWSWCIFWFVVQAVCFLFKCVDSKQKFPNFKRIYTGLSILLNAGLVCVIFFQMYYLFQFTKSIDPSNALFGTLVCYMMYNGFIALCIVLHCFLMLSIASL